MSDYAKKGYSSVQFRSMNGRHSQYRHENWYRRPSCRPFRARAGGDSTQGSAFGSTQGYIPAAASRLKMLAVLPDANEMANALERGLEKTCRQEWRHGTQECVRHVGGLRYRGDTKRSAVNRAHPFYSVSRERSSGRCISLGRPRFVIRSDGFFCQGRSKFGPLRRSKSRPVGAGGSGFRGTAGTEPAVAL